MQGFERFADLVRISVVKLQAEGWILFLIYNLRKLQGFVTTTRFKRCSPINILGSDVNLFIRTLEPINICSLLRRLNLVCLLASI